MVLFNYSTKELTAKIVYYGPGLCGKTTNLQFIHKNLSDNVRGKMLSLATKTDRTLFFDFLPMDLGEIRGMKTRMQLYTVPGQVFYNETRKLVLKGADGIVFVADSQKEMLGPNVESFKNLEENLKAHGLNLAEMPHVLQFNKRDLPKLATIEELNADLNKYNAPFYESVATTGIGVQDSLKAITKLVLLHLTKKYDPRTAGKAAASTTRPSTPASIPVATPPPPVPEVHTPAMAAASATTTTETTPAVPSFAATEIDDLMNEVQEAPRFTGNGETEVSVPVVSASTVETETPAQTHAETPTETETEPVVPDVEPLAETTGIVSNVEVAVEATPSDDPTVALTDALSDGDLFNDPSLEVANLAPGDVREIIIPVVVGQEDAAVRRFKLSVRLRLDPVE